MPLGWKPSKTCPTPKLGAHFSFVQRQQLTSKATAHQGPSVLLIAQDQPFPVLDPPWRLDVFHKIAFVQPAVVRVLETTAPVAVRPLDLTPRPPHAFSAVKPLACLLFSHPTYDSAATPQAKAYDFVNRGHELWFHTVATPSTRDCSPLCIKSTQKRTSHLSQG